MAASFSSSTLALSSLTLSSSPSSSTASSSLSLPKSSLFGALPSRFLASSASPAKPVINKPFLCTPVASSAFLTEEEMSPEEIRRAYEGLYGPAFSKLSHNESLLPRFLEEAFKDDRELQDIIGDSIENPEEMRKRVNERVKRKEKDILQPKTGSAVPMKVSFSDFDATDSYIWMELYNTPSEKDIDIIGSVIRAWYLLGCLGGYNSLNMQLTRVPVNERLSYNEKVEDEILPACFNNIGELEFQHNWGRFWVDLGTSDPLALDIFINSFTAVSSDYVGIKKLSFGGQNSGHWNEEMTSEEEGYRSFKI